MAEHWQGTGEARVRLPPSVMERHYKAQWPLEDLIALAELVSERFGVQAPNIQKSGGAIRRRGTYFPLQQKVVLYRLWPGVLLHELAHHIVHYLHPTARPHGREFYAMCTDIWRVASDSIVNGLTYAATSEAKSLAPIRGRPASHSRARLT
jgi:SprT-like family protein